MEYWRSRVEEAGNGTSRVVEGDPNTEDDSVYESVFDRFGFVTGSLLEVGCAWGRMFPIYLERGLAVSGVDISEAMIIAAKEGWHGKGGIIDLQESSAEQLPYDDACFDNLTCLAVFDATYQHQALTEFLRVTKPGARIYVTGKNNLYYGDDTEALAAEVGARRKGHPNYFTDVKKVVELLEQQGHMVQQGLYFSRRGDFATFKYEEHMPERFYEYLLVITRGDTYEALPEISSDYSKTFIALNC